MKISIVSFSAGKYPIFYFADKVSQNGFIIVNRVTMVDIWQLHNYFYWTSVKHILPARHWICDGFVKHVIFANDSCQNSIIIANMTLWHTFELRSQGTTRDCSSSERLLITASAKGYFIRVLYLRNRTLTATCSTPQTPRLPPYVQEGPVHRTHNIPRRRWMQCTHVQSTWTNLSMDITSLEWTLKLYSTPVIRWSAYLQGGPVVM